MICSIAAAGVPIRTAPLADEATAAAITIRTAPHVNEADDEADVSG